MENLKKIILERLEEIEKTAKITGFTGQLEIEFEGISFLEWEDTLDKINEYPKEGHNIEIAPGVNVALLLG